MISPQGDWSWKVRRHIESVADLKKRLEIERVLRERVELELQKAVAENERLWIALTFATRSGA